MATGKQPTRDGSDRLGTGAVGLAVAALLLVAVGLPVVGVARLMLWRSEGGGATTDTPVFVWGSIWITALYAGGIGVLATVLGLPGAWLMRTGRAWVVGLMVVPLLMPSYLAYAGWGLMRGPGSWIGDWLGRGSPWVSTAFDRGLAVVGLSLWAWPIASLVIGMSARRIPGHLLDALHLEPAGWVRRLRLVLGMLLGPIAASIGLIALVMAGSAIPLHLAQVQTYAIHLWKYMSLTTDAASVWPAAVPLLLVAGGAAAVLVRALGRPRLEVRDEGGAANRPVSRVVHALAIGVWGLSVVAPIVLFVLHLRRWTSLADFWTMQHGVALNSLGIAGVVGLFVAALGAGVFALRARRGRPMWLARGGLWALLATALVPGVLVGSATLAFWNAPFLPRAAGDSIWPVVLAHVARFGFVGVLTGWWLAGLETSDERGARLMLGGDGLGAWAALCLRPNIAAVIGVGLGAAALSLHEIEATVLLQPAGLPLLAQYLLERLHYNRNEELCAACINVLVIGTVLAAGAGWMVGLAVRRAGR